MSSSGRCVYSLSPNPVSCKPRRGPHAARSEAGVRAVQKGHLICAEKILRRPGRVEQRSNRWKDVPRVAAGDYDGITASESGDADPALPDKNNELDRHLALERLRFLLGERSTPRLFDGVDGVRQVSVDDFVWREVRLLHRVQVLRGKADSLRL